MWCDCFWSIKNEQQEYLVCLLHVPGYAAVEIDAFVQRVNGHLSILQCGQGVLTHLCSHS